MRYSKLWSHKRPAFSLIELLVVLAIGAIVLSVIVFTVVPYRKQATATEALAVLKRNCELAKDYLVKGLDGTQFQTNGFDTRGMPGEGTLNILNATQTTMRITLDMGLAYANFQRGTWQFSAAGQLHCQLDDNAEGDTQLVP